MSSPSRDPVIRIQEEKSERGTGSGNDAGAENTKIVPITVADQVGTEVTFKIKRAKALSKLIKAYCQLREIGNPKSVRFLHDGTRIQDEDTADSLEMDDHGRIDVHMFQEGGGDYQ
ncbi:hypothetical protein MFRU_036g00340 [Monilinia fructicola]|nr:hypothetical protein MFRU_036g00340 [Monilinia fructicola]